MSYKVMKINPTTKLPIFYLSENCSVTPINTRETICAKCWTVRAPRHAKRGLFCARCTGTENFRKWRKDNGKRKN